MLNKWQLGCRDAYAGGDFNYVTTIDECREVGDTLFLFLMLELADKEGCDSFEEACQRLENAQRDIQVVLDALVPDNP